MLIKTYVEGDDSKNGNRQYHLCVNHCYYGFVLLLLPTKLVSCDLLILHYEILYRLVRICTNRNYFFQILCLIFNTIPTCYVYAHCIER